VEAGEKGYRRLLEAALTDAPGRRIWAVEGTGTYGAGLTTFLQAAGEAVGEVERPKRERRQSGKSDVIDAVRAAREALGKEQLAEPRQAGLRATVRLLLVTRREVVSSRTRAYNQLHALVVTAPEQIRSRFLETSRRFHSGERLVKRCIGLRVPGQSPLEVKVLLQVMRQMARRVAALDVEAKSYEAELRELMNSLAPELLAQPGFGVFTAAEVLIAWSHRGRVHSEAAFAKLAGVAPLEASSGQVIRHRLNRGGDRRLNMALHQVVLSRMRYDAETQAYVTRRRAEGKSARDIRRCLKRFVARRLFRLLEGA
jgi:transposase